MMDGNLPTPPKPERETVDYTFHARFPSQCGWCNLPIREGDEVAKTTRERYVHRHCAEVRP